MENKHEIKLAVSNIFNSSYFIQSEGKDFKSAYRRLGEFMTNELGLSNYDVDEVVDLLEDAVADYIMENTNC